MSWTKAEAIHSLERDLERWRADLARAEAAGFKGLEEKVRTFIKAGEELLVGLRLHA